MNEVRRETASSAKDDERTPHDGRPFYCAVCGAGFSEYIACEDSDCELESVEDARARLNKADKTPAKNEQNGA